MKLAPDFLLRQYLNKLDAWGYYNSKNARVICGRCGQRMGEIFG
jgi:hypothetical protein